MLPVFFVSNIFEWWIHKYAMHRLIDVWALRAIYDRHTRQHHQHFTDGVMTVDSTREFRIIFFPWRALFTFIGMGIPAALALAWLINANAGYILLVAMVGQYLIYETFHYCCHVHENWFVRNMPCVNTIRRHHTAHHNQRIMMDINMNLTVPIADWLMGTSDLKRGLVGHVFNGYNESHIKPELRQAIAKHTLKQPPRARIAQAIRMAHRAERNGGGLGAQHRRMKQRFHRQRPLQQFLIHHEADEALDIGAVGFHA